MRNPAGRRQDDAETLSKFLLLRLDAPLRALLTVVQQYQAEHNKCSSQRQLQILKQQADLLHKLDQELQELSRVVQTRQQSLDLWNRALEPLAEYLALPLLAIIKGTHLNWNLAQSQQSASADRVLYSSQWKTVELAAKLLQSHIPLASCTTQQQQRLKVLLACAWALPSGQQLEEMAATGETDTRLDRGTDCCLALLKLVQHAVVVADDTATLAADMTSQTPPAAVTVFSEQVANALNGALVARIVDTCVTILKINQQSEAFVKASNATIQSLLTAVPLSSTWRAAFPGCFGGLYQSLLKYTRATTIQSNLAVATLQTLIMLLRITLVSVDAKTNTAIHKEQALSQLQAKLQSLSLQANGNGEAQSASGQGAVDIDATRGTLPSLPVQQQDESPEEAFYSQVRKRIASPMILLIRQLAAARAATVRRKAVDLYQLLLLETAQTKCWTLHESTEASSEVIKAALESCMILMNDSDDSVAAAANEVVRSYGLSSRDAAPIDTIMALMEELPALAQSQRQMELRMKLKLLAAYLSMNVSSKTLYSRLSVDGSPTWIQTMFAPVLDVDFESFDSSIPSSVSLVATVDAINRPNDPVLRFLDDDSRKAAMLCLQRIGSALGSTRAALLVDAIVAGIYESLADRTDRQLSMTGLSQVAWLHEIVGSVVLARGLLLGAFPRDMSDCNEKKRRRQIHVLKELAKALMPIITSSIMFGLPTSTRLTDSPQDGSITNVVTSALRGNSAFTVSLLDLIESLFTLLGPASCDFTPTTLFSVLEKSSWLNSTLVQDMAMFVLDQIARSNGHKGRTELILANIDTLLGSMNARLRIPGGSMVASNYTLDRNVVLVTMAAAVLLRLLSVEAKDSSTHLAGIAVLPQVQQLFGNLTIRFDHQAIHLSNKTMEALVFLQLFDAVLSFLVVSNGVNDANSAAQASKEEAISFNWSTILEPFKVDELDGLSPADGFAQSRVVTTPPKEPEGLNRSILSGQLLFVYDIFARSTYLLSHSSLKVQLASCKVLTRGFQFLGWVAASVPELEDENNGPTTAILRQVHTHWPPISARLSAASSTFTLTETQQSSLLIPSSSSWNANELHHAGELRVFLSQLFVLVGTMCECAGDFMSSHYREIVWPCVGKTIGLFLPLQPKPKPRSRLLSGQNLPASVATILEPSRRFSESEYGLLLGVLRCLSHVYSRRPMGMALSNLIAPTGAMILPLFEHEMLHSAAMDTVQKMLCIDGDSLYRPLMIASGRAILRCPWHGASHVEEQEVSSAGKLEMAACSLLDFISSLPEQSLE